MKKGIVFLCIGAAVALLLAAIVQLLWNAILPEVMAVRPLTYGQALGLLVLCRILFGGFGFRGGWRSGPSHRFKDRWMHMNETERAQFKEAWKRRCEKK